MTYTIDSNGLRISPPVQKERRSGTVLFFGCSFTFGEGLEDDQTLPYQVGILSQGRYDTLNFGFHGYGPQQMLAAIQSGNVRHVVDSSPQFAVYQALPHHVVRVAGKAHFGRHDPRYRLHADGTLRVVGHFDDETSLHARLELEKSEIYRMLATRDLAVSENDVDLYLAVVGRSRDLLVKEYPGIEFHVILREQPAGDERAFYPKLLGGLRQLNMPVHLVEDILPAYRMNLTKYVIDASDFHPNALANRLLAEYVSINILRCERRVGSRYIDH